MFPQGLGGSGGGGGGLSGGGGVGGSGIPGGGIPPPSLIYPGAGGSPPNLITPPLGTTSVVLPVGDPSAMWTTSAAAAAAHGVVPMGPPYNTSIPMTSSPSLMIPNPNMLPTLNLQGTTKAPPVVGGDGIHQHPTTTLGNTIVDHTSLIASLINNTAGVGGPSASSASVTPFAAHTLGRGGMMNSNTLLPGNLMMQHHHPYIGSQVTTAAAAFQNLASLVPGINHSAMAAGQLPAVVPTYNVLSSTDQINTTDPSGGSGGGITGGGKSQQQHPRGGSSSEPTTEPEWKEYKSSEGRIFWHNSKTNRSTWEKPDELRTDFERLLSTISTWREFPQNDGEAYWHNTETKESEWEIPAEVLKIKNMQAQLDSEDWTGITLEGKSDARRKFKEFLERKGVGHLAVWETIHKILTKDHKWSIFNNVLTLGERKHIFNEYVNTMMKKYKEDRRLQKVAARDKLAEFLQAWKNGEAQGLPRLQPDSVYEELPDSADWRVLDTRERFEMFEEVVSQVASNSFQKCSNKQAEEITKWLKIICRNLLPDDSTLDEVVAFTRRYFPHDISDVNDLSICQQWKSLMTNSLTMNNRTHCFDDKRNITPTAKVFLYESKVRKRFRELLQACEARGLLNAKTEAVEFWRCELPSDLCDDTQEPIGVGDVVEQKRAQILAKLKTNVMNWLEKIDASQNTPHHDSKGSGGVGGGGVSGGGSSGAMTPPSPSQAKTPAPHLVCLDNRVLALHLQGGSSVLELFNDYVYVLWDLYEVVRDEAKARIHDQQLKTPEDVETWLQGLHEKYQKPGVLGPLRQYCLKRIGRSNTNTEEDDEEEEGGIPNPSSGSARIEEEAQVRETGEIFEGET